MTCYILSDLVSPGDGLWPKVAANALVGRRPEPKKGLRLAVKNLPKFTLAEFGPLQEKLQVGFFILFFQINPIRG